LGTLVLFPPRYLGGYFFHWRLRIRTALGGHPADGEALEFRRGLQPELFLDVPPVHVHRFGT
jgi:hypothetical protein